MDHRHFEEWLLTNSPLAPDQRRALEAHLRTCKACAATAEVNLALQRVSVARPASGFSNRFQARLATRKVENRRRAVMGGVVLTLGGLGLLAWLLSFFLPVLRAEPAQAFTMWVSYLMFLFTSAQALGQAGSVMLKVFGGFVPAFVWMIVLSALAGSATLWSFTIWKTTQVTRRV